MILLSPFAPEALESNMRWFDLGGMVGYAD